MVQLDYWYKAKINKYERREGRKGCSYGSKLYYSTHVLRVKKMNRSVSPPVYYHGYYSYLTSVKRPMGPWHRYVFHSLLYCKLIYFSIHLFAPMWLNYIVLLLCFIEPFGLYKSWVSRGSCSHTREGNSVIHEHIQEGVKTVLKDGLQDFTLTDAETGT